MTAAKPSTRRLRRVLVIFNPTAGWRRRGRFNATLRRIRRLGCEWTVRETDGPGDAKALAVEAADSRGQRDGYDVVVVAGGDGTINEVVGGLIDGAEGTASMPLAILPLGTANVLAAEIGLGTDPEAVARVIAAGRVRPIHLGLANGHPFAVMAGVGLDAHVVEGVNLTFKRWSGKLAYIWRTLGELLRGRRALYRVTIDGRSYEAAAVIVANARHYAGRFVCAPEARLDDALLHVVLFRNPGRYNAVRYVLATVLGRLGRLSDVEIVPATSLTIEGPAGDPVQGDGDILCRLPVEITLAPNPLSLLQPG